MGKLGKRPRDDGGGGAPKSHTVQPPNPKRAAVAAAPPAAPLRRPAGAPDAAAPTVAPPPPRGGKAVAVSANWVALRAAIGAGRGAPQRDPATRRPAPVGNDRSVTRVLALDCEMVGTGPDGARSALARVVVVNAVGNVVYDSFVRPVAEVTDYRTAVSGIRPHNLQARPRSDVLQCGRTNAAGGSCVSEQGAPTLAEVQPHVAALLTGRLLVGHALKNDLKALLLSHPRRMIRDTAAYAPLMRAAPHVGGPTAAARRGRSAKLKDLAAAHLGLTIQEGEHSAAEDARAALLLYQRYAAEWEASLTGAGRAAGKAARESKAASARGIAGMGQAADVADDAEGGARKRQRERHGGVARAREQSAAAAPERVVRAAGWSEVVARAARGGPATLPPPRVGGGAAWRGMTAGTAAAAQARPRGDGRNAMFTSE